jgi:hypothetical protein
MSLIATDIMTNRAPRQHRGQYCGTPPRPRDCRRSHLRPGVLGMLSEGDLMPAVQQGESIQAHRWPAVVPAICFPQLEGLRCVIAGQIRTALSYALAPADG